MIKLIATDIDGTLLRDGTLMLDPEYMTVIEKLIAKGIRFVACYGRQIISERKLFATISATSSSISPTSVPWSSHRRKF